MALNGIGNGNGNGGKAWFLVRTLVTIAGLFFFPIFSYLYVDMNTRIAANAKDTGLIALDQAKDGRDLANLEKNQTTVVVAISEMTRTTSTLTGQVIELQTRVADLTDVLNRLRGSDHEVPMVKPRR